MISYNTANGNGANGITVAKGGHTLVGNVTRNNLAWGINAGLLTIDGGRNAASGNAQVGQCLNVFCKEEWNPPETTIDEHPPESTRDGTASFVFSATDDMSAQSELRFECRLYRDVPSEFTACVSPQSFTGLSTGTYTFEVRAIDRVDNVDETPATFTWSIDNTPPETTIDSGPDELPTSTSATFEFSADEVGSSFECALDGDAFEACESPASYSGLPAGEHTLQVRATDRAGNTDPTPASYSWVVDTVAPETSIGDRPADPTNSRSASLSFAGEDDRTAAAGLRFECRLDGGEFAACSSPSEYSDLSDGPHTFEVRAIDLAGNVDGSPASYSWVVDTVAPETSIGDRPSNPSNSRAATLSFAGEDDRTAADGLRFECRLDGGEFASLLEPEGLRGPRRGPAHLPGAGDRPGGQRGPVAGELFVGG